MNIQSVHIACKAIAVSLSLSIVLANCARQPEVDKMPDVEVEMFGNAPLVLEGKRKVDFNLYFNNKYKMLKPGFEKGLIADWEVQVPPTLRILEGDATIIPIPLEHRSSDNITIVTTRWEGYELKVKLKVELVSTKATSATYDVIARFPAVLTVTKAMEVPLHGRVPEIHFRILQRPEKRGS